MSKAMNVNQSNFQDIVLNADEPVLVDFYADWCMPCRMLAPMLDQLAEQFQGRAKIVKINVDENPALASQFNVRSIPTLVLFQEGKPVDTAVGMVSQDVLARKLESVAV